LIIATILGEDGISIESSEDVNFQKLYELGKEKLKKQISANIKLDARIQELTRSSSSSSGHHMNSS